MSERVPLFACTSCTSCWHSDDLREHDNELWCDLCWDYSDMRETTDIDWGDLSPFVLDEDKRIAVLDAENKQLRLDAHTKDAFYGGRVEELEAKNQRLREALTAIREAAEHKAELHPTLLWIADKVNEVAAGSRP